MSDTVHKAGIIAHSLIKCSPVLAECATSTATQEVGKTRLQNFPKHERKAASSTQYMAGKPAHHAS